MKRKGLLEGSSSGIESLGRVLCRVQRACRKLIEFFRWCISISPCMTPSKYRPWGFLEFKNIHRSVLQLQWLQTPGEFPQLGFHINIDSFFFSPPFSFTRWIPKISGVNSVPLCSLSSNGWFSSSVFFPWHISINYSTKICTARCTPGRKIHCVSKGNPTVL